jgi:hypothetical protein
LLLIDDGLKDQWMVSRCFNYVKEIIIWIESGS